MTKHLTRDEAAKVATLARLKLDEGELEQLSGQLAAVLDYVDMLNEVDTENVDPMAHTFELSNVLREDEVLPSLSREDALSNAPKTDGRYFLVPAILDGA